MYADAYDDWVLYTPYEGGFLPWINVAFRAGLKAEKDYGATSCPSELPMDMVFDFSNYMTYGMMAYDASVAKKTNQFKQPSGAEYFCDSYSAAFGGYANAEGAQCFMVWTTSGSAWYDTFVDYRHNRQANIAFIDGHVQSVTPEFSVLTEYLNGNADGMSTLSDKYKVRTH